MCDRNNSHSRSQRDSVSRFSSYVFCNAPCYLILLHFGIIYHWSMFILYNYLLFFCIPCRFWKVSFALLYYLIKPLTILYYIGWEKSMTLAFTGMSTICLKFKSIYFEIFKDFFPQEFRFFFVGLFWFLVRSTLLWLMVRLPFSPIDCIKTTSSILLSVQSVLFCLCLTI